MIVIAFFRSSGCKVCPKEELGVDRLGEYQTSVMSDRDTDEAWSMYSESAGYQTHAALSRHWDWGLMTQNVIKIVATTGTSVLLTIKSADECDMKMKDLARVTMMNYCTIRYILASGLNKNCAE